MKKRITYEDSRRKRVLKNRVAFALIRAGAQVISEHQVADAAGCTLEEVKEALAALNEECLQEERTVCSNQKVSDHDSK